MANTKSAAKRARQTITRTLHNKRALTNIKKALKKARAEIAAKNKDAAKASGRELASILDRAVKMGRIHRNVANRQKSALNKRLVALA